MNFNRKVLIGFGVASALVTGNALADELVVSDCNGATRAVEQIEANAKRDLTLNLGSDATSIKGTLTNSISGEKKASNAKDNSITFKGVSAGKWNFCLTPNANVEKVAFIAPETGSSTVKTALVGAGVLGGGVAAAMGNNSGSASLADTTSNTTRSSVTSRVTTSESPATTAAARRPRPLADTECSPGTSPTPISVFQ